MRHRTRVNEARRELHDVMEDLASQTDIRTPSLWQKKRRWSKRQKHLNKRREIAEESRRANRS